jgi:hypothetical protein
MSSAQSGLEQITSPATCSDSRPEHEVALAITREGSAGLWLPLSGHEPQTRSAPSELPLAFPNSVQALQPPTGVADHHWEE